MYWPFTSLTTSGNQTCCLASGKQENGVLEPLRQHMDKKATPTREKEGGAAFRRPSSRRDAEKWPVAVAVDAVE
ncbi:uncharacterized protein SPSK_10980 [Sporothrix schenckii 1099-18]|uniref:Uncharacterized protein n=1 Tax=Sporothrix schenckii 1099-18 TaxID=1397361 RepID=A0A0F2LVR3_SPOSC|nr:uncharacterized protein SPSK_10980 [Sporothrix schenckii 1099-18]KJR81562.1 hypothetical protein SPSK_10980 [Sporothrix schenckii 1099-18]